MNINPINNDSNNISMHGLSWSWFKKGAQKAFDKIPEVTKKERKNSLKNWDKINDFTSHPMWNRAIMGVTALLTQPPIDYYNHRVDDETKVVSRNRTIAKILAGTAVGMAVRGPVTSLVKKMTDINGKTKFSKFLLPKSEKILNEIVNNKQYLSNYRSTIAMAVALAIMTYTNFKCDAPLTTYFTNEFNKKSGINPPKEQNKSESEVIYA